MESDQIITALKSLLSAAEREFDTKRCRHSSLKALFAARKVLRSVAALAEPDPESEPAPTDPERAIIGWVSDNCGLTVAQEAELARRLEPLRAAVPSEAEVEDAIESFEDATHIEARHGVGAALLKEFNAIKIAARDALRALIARRVAAAEKERDEARAEAQQELADLHAELDTVRDERNEARALLHAEMAKSDEAVADLRAEVERLRAAAKDAAPAKETP